MTHARALLPFAVAVALTGCGISNPYQASDTTRSTSTATAPATSTISTVNDPSDPPPSTPGPRGTIPSAAATTQNKLTAGAGEPTPQAALQRYAQLSTNWTSSTLGVVQRELAAISLDQARDQALQAAASYAHDTVLQHSQVANTGTVASIAVGQGAARGRWVVVTRETTTGQGDYSGLPPTLHVTYAQLNHTPHGWIVTAWNPQT
jgi:hypothetical protein